MKQAPASSPEVATSTSSSINETAAPSVNASTGWKASLLRIIERATPLQLGIANWIASAMMVITLLLTPVLSGRTGMMNLTESWGALERVALWQRSLEWVPGITHDGLFASIPVPVIVYTFRLGMAAAFVLQGWAFWQAWNGRGTSIWKWLIGPIGAHIVMLLLVPTNADVFFYAMSGNIANDGGNPYVDPLYQFPYDPFLPFNHWIDMTTVYGPFWTDINRVIAWLGQSDPVATVYVFKVFIGLVAFSLVGLVYWLAKHVTGNIQLATAAAVLVAWQPNMVFESTGQVHNDILMMLLITAAVALVIYGGLKSLRGAIVLATASVMIKYLTLPMVGVLGLLRLAERRRAGGLKAIFGQWLIDGLAIVAVLTAGFLPYWDGIGILTELFKEPGRLFSHPFWAVQYFALENILPWKYVSFYVDTVRTSLQIASVLLIGWAVWILVTTLWTQGALIEDEEDDATTGLPWWTGHLLVAFAAVITTLSLVPVNSHPWYWTWPVVPIALLVTWQRSEQSDVLTSVVLPRWFWLYVAGNGILTLIYNTRIVHN